MLLTWHEQRPEIPIMKNLPKNFPVRIYLLFALTAGRKYFFIGCLLLFAAHSGVRAQDWQLLSTNTSFNLLGMQCMAPDTLIMFGEDGILLKSNNGGAGFSSVQNASAFIYTAAFFRNVDTGFVGNGSGNIQRTYNGGSSWATTGGCTCFITAICFSDKQHGVYGGLAGTYVSSDAGTSWSVPAGMPYFVPAEMKAFDDSVFIAIYHKGIYRSTDYGVNWSFDTLVFTGNYYLTEMSFLDNNTGFTISGDGQLFTTTNQGVDWSQVSTSGITGGDGLIFTDLLNGYFISGQNKIYRTTDGGIDWELDYSASEVLSDLAFDGHAVYACGQHGLALKKELVTMIADADSPAAFQLFPNPARNEIRCSGIKEWESVSVYNSMGGMIFYCGNFTGSKLDISGLPPGFYSIRISAQQHSYSGSFQKL